MLDFICRYAAAIIDVYLPLTPDVFAMLFCLLPC